MGNWHVFYLKYFSNSGNLNKMSNWLQFASLIFTKFSSCVYLYATYCLLCKRNSLIMNTANLTKASRSIYNPQNSQNSTFFVEKIQFLEFIHSCGLLFRLKVHISYPNKLLYVNNTKVLNLTFRPGQRNHSASC